MINLGTLNPQQRQAVETIHGPVLILAGAGTGKTRVITFRIAHMIERGVAPGQILGVTFTNKAAREMQERVLKLIPKQRKAQGGMGTKNELDSRPERPTICTFHSLCVRILRQHIEKLGYKRNFVIYDQAEQLGAVKKILAHISGKGAPADASEVLALISKLRNSGIQATFMDASERAMAQTLSRRYETALRACNAVDFDDLILLTLRLFGEHPEALEACRAKYRYVMVDEYQDTNAAQFKLIHSLTSQHRNLCVVGDDDQSIYGWRGAEISNLLDMEKHYPDVKVIKLEQNYRSTNTILNAANAVIQRNLRRRGKKLWSQKGEGPKIKLYTCASDEEEAKTVVELIEFSRAAHRTPWGHNAILFRTNGQSRQLEMALRQANVRYHLIGGQSFFDRREVRDVLAFFKALINPDDDISLLRIANVPARGLSDVTMERLIEASHERKCSVFTVMKNPVVVASFPARTQESIGAFVHLLERTRAVLHSDAFAHEPRGLQNWADRFLDEIGYYGEVRKMEKTAENAENRVKNLKEMLANVDLTESANKRLYSRLEQFLEEVTLDNEREDEEEKAPDDAVTLITMHSCKGLEYQHVYIVGLEDGLLPHERSKETNTIDEERRLFYVAITRAQQTLTISHCAGRMKYGQISPRNPSQFLKELPPELVEHASEKAKQAVAPSTGKDLFAAMRAALD